MKERIKRRFEPGNRYSTVLTLVVIAAIVVGLAIWGIPRSAKALDDRPTPSAEVLNAVTVDTPTEKCVPDDKSLGTVNMRVESMAPVGTGPGERLWSDSVALPMAGNDQVLSLGQIMDTVCHDPHYGHVVANGLAKLDVGNVALASRNDWLMSLSLESVPSSAAAYMPTLNLETLSFAQATEAIKKNLEWQVAASYINTLLRNLSNLGYHSPESEWNIHLTGFDASVELPTVGLNDHQENLPALVLGLTEKGQECPIVQIAFNTGDKRPEGVDVCEEQPMPAISTPVQEAPQRVVPQQPTPVNPVGQRPNPPVVNPPIGPPVGPPPVIPPPPPPPPVCPPDCPPTDWGKTGPVPVEEGILPAPPDVFEPAAPQVPSNPFVPDLPESLPAAPITGDSSSDAGAVAPGASHSMPEGMDRGSSGAGTPPPVDTAAEAPAGATGIGESSEPVG